MTRNPIEVATAIFLNSFASGFVHRLMRRYESPAKRLMGKRAASSELVGAAWAEPAEEKSPSDIGEREREREKMEEGWTRGSKKR